MLGAKAARYFYPLFTCYAVTDSDSGRLFLYQERRGETQNGEKEKQRTDSAAWQEDPCEQVHQQAWLHQA